MLTRSGPLSLATRPVTLFTKSEPAVERPNIQVDTQPLSADEHGDGVQEFYAFPSSACRLRPHSRGLMKIQSSEAQEYPAIHPNHLSDERDYGVAVGWVQIAQRIAEVPSLVRRLIDEYVPERQFHSDDEALLHVTRQHSQTIHHPTSTCKTGYDEAPVVDGRLGVQGIQHLMMVDAPLCRRSCWVIPMCQPL